MACCSATQRPGGPIFLLVRHQIPWRGEDLPLAPVAPPTGLEDFITSRRTRTAHCSATHWPGGGFLFLSLQRHPAAGRTRTTRRSATLHRLTVEQQQGGAAQRVGQADGAEAGDARVAAVL